MNGSEGDGAKGEFGVVGCGLVEPCGSVMGGG